MSSASVAGKFEGSTISKILRVAYRNSNAQLDNGFEGIENGEEVARSKRGRLERGHQGKLGWQLFREVHSVGLLHFGSGSKAKCRKSVHAVVHIKIIIIRHR